MISGQERDTTPLVEVGTLVVASPRQPFGRRRWVILFTYPNLTKGLGRAARSVLFTLLSEGLERNGVIILHRESLRGLYSRTALVEALRELEERGIVRRGRDSEILRVNPAVAYGGPARLFQKALESWEEDLTE